MSAFKNDAARTLLAEWYQTFVAELEAESPVTFRTVETSAGATNVLLTGPEDAPPLLCFHGAMGSAPSALFLIRPLIPHFRFVFPDTVGQPGRSAETSLPLRGDAYAGWAREVLDGMALDRVRCLGISMGGYIALKLAEYHPERIERLSLWAPGGLVNGRALDSTGLALAMFLLYLFPGSDFAFRQLTQRLFTDTDRLYLDYYRDAMANLTMDRRMPELAPDGGFANLEAPVQLLANGDDVLFPAQPLVARARRLFPKLDDVQILPGIRHVPPFDLAEVAGPLDAIRRFLVEPAHPAGG
jgi:pimeloyl-ACP methyl ester carboxylesterase